MANYTPTCSEYGIDVPAPKDAEGRRVLLDTLPQAGTLNASRRPMTSCTRARSIPCT